MTDEELLAFYDHPPVKEGFVRIYEDHTGRWYKDVPESELEPDDSLGWELMQILNEEIKKVTMEEDVTNLKRMYEAIVSKKPVQE